MRTIRHDNYIEITLLTWFASRNTATAAVAPTVVGCNPGPIYAGWLLCGVHLCAQQLAKPRQFSVCPSDVVLIPLRT
ncbi:hypothetical protein HBI73_155240 [Parastagonospora nodorum]|nr:hypothetical protein HBI73_155240 [Parastagonospora nodorum]